MWFLQRGLSPYIIFIRIVSILVVLLLVLPFHEWAHGFAAYKLGDPTAKRCGRLTFNPLASIDPIGALVMLFFGIGWAKPVPVDSRYFRRPKRDIAITAACGPLANIVAAIIGALIFQILSRFSNPNHIVCMFFAFYVEINVSLAVFNLLPIPPLDGSRILASILPNHMVVKYYMYQSTFIIVTLLLMATGLLSVPLNYISDILYNFVFKIASTICPS